MPDVSLPYTIAFCLSGDKVLMVKRLKPPNKDMWNGIGGKIETGETPLQAVSREIMEEAELDINTALRVHYAGIVTWTTVEDETNTNKGMYAYIIDFSADSLIMDGVETPEGLLEWKDLEWVTDKANLAVVKNIPHFLPQMLKREQAVNYHCEYVNGDFDHITIHQI